MKTLWTAANIISLARIGSAPIILVLLYVEQWVNGILPHNQPDQLSIPWLTFAVALVCTFSAISDLFDGYLARKRGEVTTIGKFLDPLADKIIVTTTLIMLVKFGWAPAWIAIIIIIREITITAMRSMASAEGKVIAAGPWGKAKTVIQNIAVIFLIIHYDHFGIPVYYFGTTMLYVAFILTVYSGWDYMKKYFSSMSQA